MRDRGSIYQHIKIFDGVHVFSIAIRDGNTNSNSNNSDSLREKLSGSLGKNISIPANNN
jgi:hypothetical protein